MRSNIPTNCVPILSAIIKKVIALRQEHDIPKYWPIKELIIVSDDPSTIKSVKLFDHIISKKTNIKRVLLKKEFSVVKPKIKVQYNAVNEDFGNLAPGIIVALTKESDASIIEKIKKGPISLLVDGKSIKIEKKHLQFHESVPKQYLKAKLQRAELYLDLEKSKEVLDEGYAYEIINKVRALRYDKDILPEQQIELYLVCDPKLKSHIDHFEKLIQDSSGADAFLISTKEPDFAYQIVKDYEIDDMLFSFHINL